MPKLGMCLISPLSWIMWFLSSQWDERFRTVWRQGRLLQSSPTHSPSHRASTAQFSTAMEYSSSQTVLSGWADSSCTRMGWKTEETPSPAPSAVGVLCPGEEEGNLLPYNLPQGRGCGHWGHLLMSSSETPSDCVLHPWNSVTTTCASFETQRDICLSGLFRASILSEELEHIKAALRNESHFLHAP